MFYFMIAILDTVLMACFVLPVLCTVPVPYRYLVSVVPYLVSVCCMLYDITYFWEKEKNKKGHTILFCVGRV